MYMEENNVASQQVTAMDVDVASAEVNTGKEDDEDNVYAEESCHIAEVNAKESTQRVTEAIFSDELMAKQEDKIDEIANIEEASENLYLVELDLHARMFEDANERIAEKQKFEETLSSTILKLAAKENQVNEMYKEVESLRMSESMWQKDLLETKSLLSSKTNDLQLKVLEFEEMKEKLAVKESTEALVRSSLQKELDKSQLLEAVVAELTEKLEQMKDKCNDMESKLEQKLKYLQESLEAEDSTAQKNLEQQIMELTLVISKLEERNVEVFELSRKLEALEAEKEQMSFEAQDLKCQISELELALNQSSRMKSQLEAKLENFNERCAEHESRANATLERNLELEDLIRELESLLETEKNRINDLKQEKETRSKEYSDMVFALSTQLENAVQAEAEKEQMSFEAQDLKCQISELELALNQSSRTKSQLETKLENFNERCAEHESRANATLERNLELEDLIRELESLLDTEKNRINDLEQEKETRSKEYSDMVFALSTQLENAVQAGAEKEQMSFEAQDLKCQISELELALNQSSRMKSQLEAKLENFNERCTEHENRANATLESKLELEDLIRELESLLETEKNRINDLEQEKETRSKQYSDMVFALSTQLENVVQAEAEKEMGLEIDKEQMNCRVQELTVKMSELESTLSQTLALKCELESQVKELNDKCVVDESRANVINERNLELEELVRELEFLLQSGKSRINYLEQVLHNLEKKSVEYCDMVSTLTTQLQSASTATKDISKKLQESEWKLEEAELKNLELNDQLTFLKSDYDDVDRKLKEQMNWQVEELSAKITQVEKINAEYERKADVAQEHILELEDLASKLELLLETRKNRIKDLEQEVEILENKCGHAEAKSKEHVDMVSALTVEVENQKQLVESLNMIIEEDKRNSEKDVHDTKAKLQEVENLLQVLQIELLATQGKLEMAGIKEIEITKKLESAQVQLQEKERSLEEASIKTTELESLNVTLINDTGLKLQELAENLKNKEIEVNSLNEKLHIHEHQIQCYVEEASVMAEARTKELSHTNSLVVTNLNLTNKVGELQQLLDLANADKVAVASTITKQHETEARFLQETITHKELKVKELSYKCSNLEEQLKIQESRNFDLDCCLVKLQDQAKVIQGLEAKLTQLEMQTGALIEENMNLNGEFAEYQTKLNDLQEKLSSTLIEKDSAVQNFKTSMKVVEDLKQELSSERQSHHSRIALIMEEKQLLCKASRVAQSEVQTIKNELEGQLKEYIETNGDLIAELENLKLQATQNSVLQSRVKHLDEQLEVNESQFKKEIATIMEEKQLLREASTEAQNEVLILMSQLEEQLRKYKESNEALKAELEKVTFKANWDSGMQTRVKEVEQLLEVENVFESASRLDGDAPNEKVQQLKEELAVSPPTSSAYTELELKNDGDRKKTKEGKSSPTNAKKDHSHVKNIKVALGVALVSVVTAILAGKK